MELWQINRLKSNRFSFLHQNPDCTKVATTDFDTVSTCSSNMIFCVATGLDSAIKISIKIPTIVEEDSIESFFNSWNKILELWKRTEVSLFQSPRLWKPGFSVSWGLIFSIMISFRSFWLLAKLQVEKLSRFFLATETWWSENSQRCYYFSFNSMFKLNFIQIYIFDLFHHDPNLSVWSFDKSVEKKVIEGVPCNRILIVPKFQKNWFWWWLNLILVLDVLRSCRFGFSHQRVNHKPYSCSGVFDWGVFLFWFMHYNLDVRKRTDGL